MRTFPQPLKIQKRDEVSAENIKRGMTEYVSGSMLLTPYSNI